MKGRTCLSAKEEMAKYFSTQSDKELLNKRNWSLIYENFMNLDVTSREFKYLVQHRDEYEKLYKPEDVTTVITQGYSFALRNLAREKKQEAYQQLKQEILKMNFKGAESLTLSSDMEIYKLAKDWNNYSKTAVLFIEKYGKDDAGLLNNIAWSFYENISDKAMLEKAAEWSKHSTELHLDYPAMDTYASILFKMGKKQEARTAAEKAIELAKQSGDDPQSTRELLEKIKKMK
jgi:hypothetical protein